VTELHHVVPPISSSPTAAGRLSPAAVVAVVLAVVLAVVSLALASIGAAPAATAAVSTGALRPVADTTFNSQAPTRSYGSAAVIHSSPTSWKAYLRFPTAGLDDNATIVSAQLKVYATTTSRSRFELHPAASAWSERSTYATRPAWNATILGRSAPSTSGTWMTINVPLTAVSTMRNTNLALTGTVSGKIGFHARENVQDPQLVLSVASPGADVTPPETTITSSTTAESSASFGFTSSESGSTFTCRLDAAAWSPCTSPASYTNLSAGGHTFQVRATDSAGNTDVTPASHTWTAAAAAVSTTAPQPRGPSGPWRLAFSDEFNAASLDRTKWDDVWFCQGCQQNNVGTYSSNVSVSGGYLRLNLASATSGASVHTGYGSGRFQLPVGGYVEARVYFPGSDAEEFHNWPAWWTSGRNWPSAGEHDIVEGLGGRPTVNYHSPSGAHNKGEVVGTWNNGFHTYGIHRKATSADVYWDGQLVRSYSTDDNGGPQELIFTLGASRSRAAVTGEAGQVRVDWVRAYE
jgi:hypothetical protein